MTGPRSFSRASSASKLMPSSTPASKLSSVRGAGYAYGYGDRIV